MMRKTELTAPYYFFSFISAGDAPRAGEFSNPTICFLSGAFVAVT